MKRYLGPALLAALAVGSCSKPAENTNTPGMTAGKPAMPPGKAIKIGYVLHGLNEFTQVIKRGAEDAGKALGVEVEVMGPAAFKSADAIAMFEGMVQKKMDGIAVIPMPGDVW